MIRLLVTQIANGFSPEARVSAGLLGHTDHSAVGARVLHQIWPGDTTSVDRFQAASTAQVIPLDFGWRPPTPGRPLTEKVYGRLRFAAMLPRAAKLARDYRPDLVYSVQQYWDCQVATHVACRLDVPQVIHLHYNIGDWLHQPVLDRLRSCAHVVTVSEYIRRQVLEFGVPAERVTAILNSVEVPALHSPEERRAMRESLGIPADAPVVGIAARLDPDKGQAETIRALARLAHKHPDAHLVIAGANTIYITGYDDELKAIAQKEGVADRTHFLGQRSDMPAVLGALDIFMHPSRNEPFGLALSEAAAAALPIVAYAEGGTVEVVEDGVTGLLATPGDEDGLTERLDALLSDPARARAIGEAGRERMRRDFKPEVAGAAFNDLLQRAPWK